MIELFGRIVRIRHRKKSILKDRDWAVFDLATTSQLVNCVGVLPDIAAEGVEIWTTGEYVESKWGRQVKCRKIIAAAPDTSTTDGVRRLLTALPGIGQARAWIAVNMYGHYKAWMLAKTNPEMIGVAPCDCADAMRIANSLEYDYNTKKLLIDAVMKKEIKND